MNYGLSFLFIELAQFEVFIHVLLDLFARVEGKIALKLLFNLEVVLLGGTSVPDRHEVIVVLLWPSKIAT